jgi:acetoin:2,6-dichlorophenolindophenol oxidoreductase subunit alpha
VASTKMTAAAVGQSVAEQVDWLRSMYEIRFFEEAVQRLFTDGLVRGSTHLYQGQEAVAVGACRALEHADSMSCTYRGHGAVLAKGAPLDRSFGEIMGKAEGLCGGKGGSMHLTDVSVGAIGSFAIVGAHLPIAVGVALAERSLGTGRVSLCFFGDGCTNIGAFHEALNLASIWRLGVIFLCENNLYGEYSPIASTTPIAELADRADAYGMAKARIDGNDVREVHATVAAAVARGRDGEGPTLIEAVTYRHKGHSRTDPARYRPEGELESWLGRDPILALRRALIADGVAERRLDEVREIAEAEVAEALERAKSWAEPALGSRFEDVFA